MQAKNYLHKLLYKAACDYAESRGWTYSSYIRKLLVSDLSRRGIIRKKNKKIISVSINDK